MFFAKVGSVVLLTNTNELKLFDRVVARAILVSHYHGYRILLLSSWLS